MHNEDGLSTETCKLKPENCQLSTVNYLCGIISFQRMYQKKPHELYPIFQESGDNNQGTGVSDQGSDDGMNNEQCTMHNADNLSTETCNLKPDNCQLSTVNSSNLITPEILRLFEKHLINLLRDIINPKQPFCQTDDVNHCVYCDYSAICKRQNTKDE